MITDVSYRIKFDTILFTVYSIAYNTFVCDYLYLYFHLIQFDFILLYLILYYLISFVFYTMEFDNSFLPATVLYKIVLYAIQLYCVSLCPINCIELYFIQFNSKRQFTMQCNFIIFNRDDYWLRII